MIPRALELPTAFTFNFSRSLVPGLFHIGDVASTTGTPIGAVKSNAFAEIGTLALFARKREPVSAPSVSSTSIPVITPSPVTVSVESSYPLLLPFGCPVSVNRPFPAEASVAIHAQIRDRCVPAGIATASADSPYPLPEFVAPAGRPWYRATRTCRRAGRAFPGPAVIPPQCARLAHQQRAALHSPHAQARVILGKLGLQRVQAVVVVIDALRHFVRRHLSGTLPKTQSAPALSAPNSAQYW